MMARPRARGPGRDRRSRRPGARWPEDEDDLSCRTTGACLASGFHVSGSENPATFRGNDMGLRHPFFHRALVPALLVGIVFSMPAKADFLDDLFGGGSEPAPAPAQRARPTHLPRDNFSIKLKETRKSAQRKAARAASVDGGQYSAGSRPQKPLLCQPKPDEKTGESTAYLRDETLRAGDSIVTPDQIVVYRGGGGCPHASGEFVSLAHAGLPKGKRSALVSLQQGLRAPQGFEADDERAAAPKAAAGH